jgi:hypothetical protein
MAFWSYWRTRSDRPRAAASGGAVAQLGERLVRNEEVRGSTPLGSTTRHHLRDNNSM